MTAYSVYKMMRYQQAADSIGCIKWQRIRVVSTAMSMALLSLPLVIPQLSNTAILLRTTRVPLNRQSVQ